MRSRKILILSLLFIGMIGLVSASPSWICPETYAPGYHDFQSFLLDTEYFTLYNDENTTTFNLDLPCGIENFSFSNMTLSRSYFGGASPYQENEWTVIPPENEDHLWKAKTGSWSQNYDTNVSTSFIASSSDLAVVGLWVFSTSLKIGSFSEEELVNISYGGVYSCAGGHNVRVTNLELSNSSDFSYILANYSLNVPCGHSDAQEMWYYLDYHTLNIGQEYYLKINSESFTGYLWSPDNFSCRDTQYYEDSQWEDLNGCIPSVFYEKPGFVGNWSLDVFNNGTVDFVSNDSNYTSVLDFSSYNFSSSFEGSGICSLPFNFSYNSTGSLHISDFNYSYYNPTELGGCYYYMGSSDPSDIPPISDVWDIVWGGGSFKDIARAWDEPLYIELGLKWNDLWDKEQIGDFTGNMWDFMSLFVRYVFRQPGSLVPNGGVSDV
jgi:hypothetical protein